ncbi:putative reverse transcriptase domain-containing protein [Tanacetum coccineum]
MDNPNITMEEYIRLEDEKARRHGKVYNWETATYGKIWDNEDVHDLGSVETEFPAIVFNDTLTSEAALSCEPTVSSLINDEIDFRISFDESDDEDCTVIFDKNSFSYKIISVNNLKTDSENDNDKVNMPLLPSPEPMVSYFDDLDYFKDLEKEFPAIVYNNALTSKLDFLTEPTVSPRHIDEYNLKDETSFSECDEEEQNVLNFNDRSPFNVIYPNDLKSEKDNDDDKVDIEHSSEDLSVKSFPDVINTDVGAYAHGVLYKVEDIATYLVEYVKFWDDWEVDRYRNANLGTEGTLSFRESDLQKAYKSLKIVAASVLASESCRPSSCKTNMPLYKHCIQLNLKGQAAVGHAPPGRWSKSSDWQPGLMGADLEWKEIAEPVMELYREATDGSTIETKDSGLVWHHQDADLGLHKILASAHDISRSTVDFFNNMSHRATKLMAVLKENHKTSSQELAASEKNFKVSEVSRKIDEVSSQDNKMMLQDVSNMMQVYDDGKTEVGNSLQHWDNTKLAINRFNERNMVEIESFIRETIQVNNLRSEEIAAAYVSMDTKFQSDASDLKSCVNDSLMLDQEMKKKFDSMSKICVDHLTCLGDKHGDSTKSMLNQAEGLKKDYQVDQNCHPRKRGIDVPSLISMEAMRTPSFADLMHSETKKFKALRNRKHLYVALLQWLWKWDQVWKMFTREVVVKKQGKSDQNFDDTSKLIIPNSLKYLKCERYPFLYLPRTFQASNLIGLEMYESRMVQLWDEREKKDLKKLKFLSLAVSNLTTFDFIITQNLEALSLDIKLETLYLDPDSLRLHSFCKTSGAVCCMQRWFLVRKGCLLCID